MKHENEDDKQRRAEAKRVLDAVERDSHGVFSGAFYKLLQSVRLAPADDRPAEDAVEIWARRIGRILGFGFALVLLLNLFTGWFF